MGINFKLQATFVAALMAISAVTSLPLQAQEEERRFEDVETARVRALSPTTARALDPVRAFLAPEPEVEGGPVPEPNPQAALVEIRKVNVDRLPSHEKAEVYNLYGFIYYLLEDNQQAKGYYRRVIDEPEANAPLVVRTIKTLAQLHMIDEEYQQALDLYLEWMSYQTIIGANDYALIGTIYYSLEDFDNSLSYIERAITMREDIGEIGQENWYAIQRTIYYTRNNFPKVIEILKKLIVYYPNVRYWRELGGMYAELEQIDQQMAAYDLAWLQGGLTSESQALGLGFMYMSKGAPVQGAEVIIKGMEDGLIEENEKNFQIIGQAYYTAHDFNKALTWMERAAQLAENGESFARLANIYNSMERYGEGYEAAMEALEKGGLEEPDAVRLQAGISLLYMYRYDEALRLFRAVRDADSIEYARTWIRYTESEAARERQLRASGIDIDAIRRDING